MGKYAVVVIGPAGSGKTTFCDSIQQFYSKTLPSKTFYARRAHVINLDPAAEDLPHEVSLDIRSECLAEDVQRSDNLGPNGALVRSMEKVLFYDKTGWFSDNFGHFEDDFIILDLPGQIEIIAQIPIVPELVRKLNSEAGYKVVVCFLLDAQTAITDRNKYISACMCALSAMTAIEAPFLSFLTKTDLLPKSVVHGSDDILPDDFTEAGCLKTSTDALCTDSEMESFSKLFQSYLTCNFEDIRRAPVANTVTTEGSRTRISRRMALTEKLCHLMSEFSLVSFVPWSVNDEEAITKAADLIDYLLQFGEDEEVHEAEASPTIEQS